MYLKYHIIKVLKNCFQNINFFSWIKLQFFMTETPLQHNPHHLFIGFPISSYLIRPHASIAYTEPYAKQNQSNLLSKLYGDHNTSWVKHAAHQKAKSLRAALFQSQITRSTTTLSSMQSTLNSLQNGRCSFIFRVLFVQAITPTFSTKNPFLYFSQFSPPYSTLTYSQIHPYSPH